MKKTYLLYLTFFIMTIFVCASDYDCITISKFDLIPDGNCLYEVKNNTDNSIEIYSFKLNDKVDLLNNKFNKSLTIAPFKSKNVMCGHPDIEKMCSKVGQKYEFDVILVFEVNGKTENYKTKVKGVCKDF